MDIENKDDIADLVKLLRFQAKSYESAAADVIEHLLAYKEAMESQKPVFFWKEIGETDWMECHKDWYLKCVDSPEHDTKLLYAKPVPADRPEYRPTDDDLWDQTITERDTYHDWADNLANAISEYFGCDIGEHTSANNPWAEALEVIECADKPAVAVPVGWKEIVEAVAHIGVDFGYGAFVLSQEHINKARELLATAPSRSRQIAPRQCSIGQPTSHDTEPQVTIEHNGKLFDVDQSISDFVRLLNSVGLETVASCSGHGHRPANIALKDGREIIIARDYEEARNIDRIFPVDINGDISSVYENTQDTPKA